MNHAVSTATAPATAVAAVILSLAVSATFAAEAPSPGAAQLALATVPAKGTARLTVQSPAFKDGGDIPFENTQYRGNVFPGLKWSKGPKGTKSYAVIMQDTDAVVKGDAILHWTLYNVPASVTQLDAGMTAVPTGAMNGP